MLSSNICSGELFLKLEKSGNFEIINGGGEIIIGDDSEDVGIADSWDCDVWDVWDVWDDDKSINYDDYKQFHKL